MPPIRTKSTSWRTSASSSLRGWKDSPSGPPQLAREVGIAPSLSSRCATVSEIRPVQRDVVAPVDLARVEDELFVHEP